MDSWLKKYWYNVTRTGVVEYLKPEQQEQISLVNKTGLIAGLLSALFIGIFYRPFVEVGMLYFSIYFTILCFFVLLLNHIKKYHFATFYLFSLFSLGIFYVASVFGYDSNMHFLYIINLFAIVMAFGASDKWHLVGAISIPIILLILLFSTNFSLLKPTYLSLNYVEFVRMSVAFACIIGAIFLAYMHVNLSEKGYRRLKTEINEKQKNAQLLQQSENKLKALIENTRDNIWSVDTQFRIITMNSAFQNICKNVFLVHLEEGNNVFQGFSQEIIDYWKGIYERAFAGESFKIEWTYYNTFINRQIYVETQVSPIFNQDKKIQGATLFGRDITKRRETEKLIKQKDELLQAINQNIKEGIFRSVLDKGGIYVNESYVKMFGFESVEEALQTSPDKFYVNESDRIELVNRLLNDNHVTNQEVLYRRKDGSSFWALVSAIVTKSENGELFFDGTIKDITELKTIQVQLEKAKEIAEQSAASKTQFLSAMSHEIRTPLNAIIGISRLLLDENPKPDQIENLNTLRFSAQNLLVLINDILDFNKIEAGKVVLENIDFNLQELLKNIKLGFQIAAEDNKNLLIVQVDEQIPEFIKGDPTRLSQILTNLVGNAIKFTQKGKVTIQLGLLEKTEKEVVILFSII
ncbi:MAG: PAS domain S-box protein, partial [Thermoflexibacter sp.]|nr:PAS domain S-box protein [Thermoflexibacter sp.]